MLSISFPSAGQNKRANIWAFDTTNEQLRQLTFFYQVRRPASINRDGPDYISGGWAALPAEPHRRRL